MKKFLILITLIMCTANISKADILDGVYNGVHNNYYNKQVPVSVRYMAITNSLDIVRALQILEKNGYKEEAHRIVAYNVHILFHPLSNGRDISKMYIKEGITYKVYLINDKYKKSNHSKIASLILYEYVLDNTGSTSEAIRVKRNLLKRLDK